MVIGGESAREPGSSAARNSKLPGYGPEKIGSAAQRNSEKYPCWSTTARKDSVWEREECAGDRVSPRRQAEGVNAMRSCKSCEEGAADYTGHGTLAKLDSLK